MTKSFSYLTSIQNRLSRVEEWGQTYSRIYNALKIIRPPSGYFIRPLLEILEKIT